MARLLMRTAGLEDRAIELKLGVNRFGRSEEADISIPHPTVSSIHCELILGGSGVLLRDLESTNGTFVDGRVVREVELAAGQVLRLGDVELYVESTEVKVAIPAFVNPEVVAPPVVLHDGTLVCPRHPDARVTHRCTHCKEVMCDPCVHRMRRKGGKTVLLLCPVCSHAVEPIGGVEKPKKKSLFARVGETVKLKFTRPLHLK
ncbi:MAG: FHA domain-containing protein [Verrucomicrobiota bacterium]